MSREWKVGDRFSTEGVVTALPDSDGDYRALFDGHTADGCVTAAEMAHAKLIKPAPEEKLLDLNKPMQMSDGRAVLYHGVTKNGLIIAESDDGFVWVVDACSVKNVPEEKRNGVIRMYLVENENCPICYYSYKRDLHGRILGKAYVGITEGDGMEDEK